MQVALVASHETSPASAGVMPAASAVLSTAAVGAAPENTKKQTISSPDLTPDFDLQLLPQHAASLFKPPFLAKLQQVVLDLLNADGIQQCTQRR
jgi:hypothetical protein